MTLGETLSYVNYVDDNPVDITIDKRVLDNALRAGQLHYRLRKPRSNCGKETLKIKRKEDN